MPKEYKLDIETNLFNVTTVVEANSVVDAIKQTRRGKGTITKVEQQGGVKWVKTPIKVKYQEENEQKDL